MISRKMAFLMKAMALQVRRYKSEGLSKCVTTGLCYLTVVNPSLPPGVKYKLIAAWFIYLGK